MRCKAALIFPVQLSNYVGINIYVLVLAIANKTAVLFFTWIEIAVNFIFAMY
ncbi:hypothetical protein CRENPOLYSF1_10028 [Crenothrix polyspora]|uniref:Uncharacterized protein n=1 Tax=Crenothrix polyspora TaxID=360316 RepID=A0A1R4GYX7_9GAMM|nr:hypothetical protein CRENPOLYSF1_10028 [Crenothrix polyspora]